MSTPSQRTRYLAHWQTVNAMAASICGIKPTEADRIRADLAANTNKAERSHQRDEAAALAMQIDYLNKVECE